MNSAQVQEEVSLLWRKVLPEGEFDQYSDFISAGGNSLKVISLFVQIMKKFNVKLEIKNFARLNTINNQADFISNEIRRRNA
ncbi:acyl carrier protein [Pseudomonas sp. BT76 TE3572]|uniref:Carrier domain-containing protein n=1 Tax=Pseudomonas mandelii PD30 TaxID=1419583 RepID=A0A059L5S1_9PSED|nr:acyl carrier protein [Pseudomonas mandelii]KDD69571.1 hypothetical protein V466_08810 [Pseudomonas mandelii PD30]